MHSEYCISWKTNSYTFSHTPNAGKDKSNTIQILFFHGLNNVLNSNFTWIWKMAVDKVSRKMNVHREKLCLSVCGCRDNAIQNPTAYIFPCIYIFNMSQNISFTCMQWLLWFFLRSFTLSELCLCHIAVILHSSLTGKIFSHLKRGTLTKASFILHCLFCLNVTKWLLFCCVHSHTTHWLAALQIAKCQLISHFC